MARKSLTKKITDSYFQTASSPLRRSINAQKIGSEVLLENDDEAERLALQRKSIIHNNIPVNVPSPSKRSSMSLSYLSQIPEPQLREHISHCIKLNIENKINIKNAFSLEMIDFMTFMVTRNNSDNIDLKLAGTSLDAMTKIYIYRVDSIYTDILKMAGARDKQQKKHQFNEQENEEHRLESPVRKKRKKSKHNIISTENALKGSINTVYPSQWAVGSGDSYASDMLCQVILPNHANSGFYYHPYNDVIVDILNESTNNTDSSEYIISSVKNCSYLDMCSIFSDFKFLNWSTEDEGETQELVQEDDASRFQFDLDMTYMEKDESQPGCYFDVHKGGENVNLCARNTQQVQNVIDFRDILSTQIPNTNKQLEYSFIRNDFIHWAGPSYWKIKTFSKSLSNSKVVKTCHQTALQKKQEIILNYKDDTPLTVIEKFLPGKATKIHAKTAKRKWNREKITLPENTNYDISKLYKLYIYPSIDMSCKNSEEYLNAIELSQRDNCDNDSENDMPEDCFPIQEKNDFNELRNIDDNCIQNHKELNGDNLVTTPKLTQKTFLQYAIRAKKIDIHQLKQTIWKCLISKDLNEKMNTQKDVQTENTEEIKESKPFSTVYKSLPAVLSEKNAKALSFPIAFVSLLHLANEKCLKLSSLPDFSDIIVAKD